ncbi:MAG: hypothetical protein C0606_02075 [Hyphomicrobiales bacterium]|nr:MAG: hypothetical protein C0606_02075 [Hyphomicrobiales bacterium]
MRNVVFNEEVALTFKSRFGETPTPSELELLIALLCGQSLAEYSDSTGVSYGTRRNQLAALREKAGLKRQGDLVTVMSVILANFIHGKAGKEPASHSLLSKYLERHYKSDYRLHFPEVESGRRLLVADLGPLDGRPVLFMHSGFFPLLPMPHQADVLRRHGVRVFTPIRPGYFFVPSTSEEPFESLTDFVEDVASFLMVFNQMGTPILSQTYGVVGSLMLARVLGSTAPRIVLSAPQYSPDTGHERINKHHKGWIKLCRSFPRLVSPAVWMLAKSMDAPEKFRRGFKKTYAESPPDLSLIEPLELQPWFDELIHLMLMGNFVGFRNDLIAAHEDWPAWLSDLPNDIRIVYGAHDPYSNHVEILERLRTGGADIEIVDEFGQNSGIFHPERLFAKVFGD